MPVVTCPKCPTKLKIPDGVSGNTKCPKCGTVFPVNQAPAFEVVDAPPAQKPGTGTKPAQKPAAKVEVDEPDFEVVDDEKPKKKKSASDDDDGDGKTKVVVVYVNRDDDDDDDDEPRSKKKKSKKKKGKKRSDDDDDEWYPQGGGRGGGGAFSKGKTGALLMSISFWLNLGAFGVLTLYILIAWVGVSGGSSSSSSPRSSRGGDGAGSIADVIVILPGLVGLGAWIVGTIGCAFAIAGPAKARGMAITATVFAGVHLLLTGITFNNLQEGLGGVGRGIPGLGKIAWIFVASMLPTLDSLLPILFYQSKSINGDYAIALLAAICEALRLIFMLLTLKAMAAAARDHDAAEKSHFSMMTTIMIMGGVALGVLLMFVLLAEGGFKSPSTYMNLGFGTAFLVYIAYTLMMLSPALAAMQTKDACDRRS